ncbi:hypothetical protein JMM81_12685 [Bacillus sp. V3B]|uniref:hypothetical protein n=1 Tax=Bacillus sp. V3B TaxID=2804915 RepID=UPI0021090EB0|nr:hypothetical protein [Bacillus sp. V3B]MCQ6275808.1 hypothetical protein [Bacillus sp. V3B]
MEIKLIIEECYYVKTRDRIGETVRTNVFKHENGIYQAFSNYIFDKEEEYIGLGESYDEKEALRLSREALIKDWKESIQ